MYCSLGHQLRKILVRNFLNVLRSPPRATTNNFRESTEIIPWVGYRTVNIKKKKTLRKTPGKQNSVRS